MDIPWRLKDNGKGEPPWACLSSKYNVNHDSHWEWRSMYPVDTLWVYCRSWNNLPNTNPVGKWWVLLKSTHFNTQWVLLKKPPDFFYKVPTTIPNGYFSNKPPGFFHKAPTKVPNDYSLKKPPKFFYKVPTKIITNSQRTHWVYGWVHFGYICEYFVKKLKSFVQKVLIGYFYGHFVKEPRGFVWKVSIGYCGGCFMWR